MPTEGSPLWKQILRWTLQVIGSLTALVLLLSIFMVAINAVDDDLTPEAKAMLTPPPNPYPDKDNLYVALIGFDAPADQTPLQLGAARIKYYNDTLESRLRRPAFRIDRPLTSPAGALEFRGKAEPCNCLNGSIWEAVRNQGDQIAVDWERNRLLMERYRQLRTLGGYYETERISVLTQFAIAPTSVRCLLLKRIALDLQSGDAERVREGVEDLAAEIKIGQRFLGGDGALISKMIGAAFVHSGLILLSDAVADPKVDISAIAAQEPALFEPVAIPSWRIGSVFANEMRFAHSVYQMVGMNRGVLFDTISEAPWWDRLGNQLTSTLFKLNATTNASGEMATKLKSVADGDPATFSARRSQFDRLSAEESQFSIRWMSNPSGRLMLWGALPGYLNYPARVYDVAAFQRLVCLAYQIRQQHISREAVAGFMQQHLELSRHPIDDKPFEWDAKSGTISVRTVGRAQSDRRFSVKVAMG